MGALTDLEATAGGLAAVFTLLLLLLAVRRRRVQRVALEQAADPALEDTVIRAAGPVIRVARTPLPARFQVAVERPLMTVPLTPEVLRALTPPPMVRIADVPSTGADGRPLFAPPPRPRRPAFRS